MAVLPKTGVKVRGDVRRDQIVRAALKIIGKKGVASLTTSAIAREVGISEANVYRHVENKEEIYVATAFYVREKIRGNVEKALAGAAAPVEVLKRLFHLQLDLMEKNSGIPRFLFSEELHIQQNLREKIIQMMDAVSATLTSLIRDAQEAGSIRKDIDARTTAMMFIGLMQGLTFRWSLAGFSFSLSAEGARLWKNFERCITGKKPSTRRGV